MFGGAKNLDGVRAWQDCCISVNQDEAYKEQNEERLRDPQSGMGMSQDDIDFYDEITDLTTFKPVVDWSMGLGVSGVNGSDMSAQVWRNGLPWATVREQFLPRFNNAIEDINETM